MFCAVQKWAAALVVGNTVVLKPSPFTPLTTLAFAMMLADAFPPGVFNVVGGSDGQVLLCGPQNPRNSLCPQSRKIFELFSQKTEKCLQDTKQFCC